MNFITIIDEHGNIRSLSLYEANKLYVSYFNNFISIDGFCKYYKISKDTAKRLINKCKEYRK